MLGGHPDHTYTEVPPDVAAIRAAASANTGAIRDLPDLIDRTVLAGAVDPDALDRLVPSRGPTASIAAGSTVVTVTGTPGHPWTVLRASDMLASLTAG